MIMDVYQYYVNNPKRQGHVKKKYKATLEAKDNTFTLLASSDIIDRNNITVEKWFKAKKNAKIEKGILSKSIKCDSPSMAASIVSGTNLDGWNCWKTIDNKKMDMYRQ